MTKGNQKVSGGVLVGMLSAEDGLYGPISSGRCSWSLAPVTMQRVPREEKGEMSLTDL